MADAASLCDAFCAAVSRGDSSDETKRLQQQLKHLVADWDSLPPLSLDTPNAAAERSLALRFLEASCAFSLAEDDRDAFERAYLQLRPLYGVVHVTDHTPVLQGLYLMLLLVDNRLAEFHCELELLSEAERSGAAVAFPIVMDQQLLVGNYDAILETSRGPAENLPHSLFSVFMAHITETVRENIALAAEAAYDSLSFTDACSLLMLDGIPALEAFVTESHPEWRPDAESKRLFFKSGVKKASVETIPRRKLVEQTVGYATELERIV